MTPLEPRVRAADSIAFARRLTAGAWPEPYPQALMGADQNWLADYLAGCGFAGALVNPAVQKEWEPHTSAAFAARLQRRARADALRELSHRRTLDRLHHALEKLQFRCILLKGAALYLHESAAGLAPQRVPGDLDLLVEDPHEAAALRRFLVESGFSGDLHALRTGPHHLAPVWEGGSMVEIHTAVMPTLWRLPEAEMLRRVQPVPGWRHFHTLAFHDMLLHEAIHSTTHLWSFGLKLARDNQRILALADGAAAPLDWRATADAAAATVAPLAFWAPLLALRRAVGMSCGVFPPEFWAASPTGPRIDRATEAAARRSFTAIDDAAALNPFVRNAEFLRLMNGRSRVYYLRELLGRSASESRQAALASAGAQSWKKLPSQLLEALRSARRK